MTCEFCRGDLERPALTGCLSPVMHAAEVYTNPGKGTVLTSDSITSRLAALFMQKPVWTSMELNELIGWQFSQAVYALRRKGWRITTVKLGPKQYAYRYEVMV